MRLKFLSAAAAMIAAVGVGATAHAASTITFFNDLNSAGSSTATSGWQVGAGVTTSSSFVASASGRVSEIDVDLWNIGGDSATVSLWTDVAGVLGAQLGSWSGTGVPSYAYPLPLTRITGISGINLTAGDSYFVQLSSGSGELGWSFNDQGSVGTIIQNAGVFPENTSGAFQVLGAAVPEPATWAMLILGVAMIGSAIRRRNEGASLAA